MDNFDDIMKMKIDDNQDDIIKNTYGKDFDVMKIEIDEAFVEMAGRLPRDQSGKCNLVVAVGDRERKIAHFHVFRSENDKEIWKNGACLFFTENRYYDHSGNTETLTKDELRDLIDLLKKPYKRNRSITNWQQLVYLWNDNNDRYEIPDDTPMPDYNYKTITRYKENDWIGDFNND